MDINWRGVLCAYSILKRGDYMSSYHSIMRLMLAGAAVAVTLAGSASAADMSGTWNISATYTSGGSIVGTDTPACTFQQSGNRISGTCKGPHAIGPLEGTTNGSSVSLQWNHTATNSGGVTGSSYYQGAAGSDGVIRGNASNSSIPGATGTFTAQRQ